MGRAITVGGAAAARYLDELAGSELELPYVPDGAEPVWHLFVVRHPRRDELQQRLQQAGIGTMIHYPAPPHLQPAYAELGYGAGAFPLTEAIHPPKPTNGRLVGWVGMMLCI